MYNCFSLLFFAACKRSVYPCILSYSIGPYGYPVVPIYEKSGDTDDLTQQPAMTNESWNCPSLQPRYIESYPHTFLVYDTCTSTPLALLLIKGSKKLEVVSSWTEETTICES